MTVRASNRPLPEVAFLYFVPFLLLHRGEQTPFAAFDAGVRLILIVRRNAPRPFGLFGQFPFTDPKLFAFVNPKHDSFDYNNDNSQSIEQTSEMMVGHGDHRTGLLR